MSEYQYYEFRAVDCPLTQADQEMLRALSTRARITSTSFTNEYQWGNFKGDPQQLLEHCFDLHLYVANWGSRRLMMRLPCRLVGPAKLDAFVRDVDWVDVRASGEHLIVDIFRHELESDWVDGQGWLDALAPLRADVLSGDLRAFYLLWLTAVEEDLLPDDGFEPLPGMGPLNNSLEAFAEFFDIDPDLVQAAAERPHSAPIPAEALRDVLAAIPEAEKMQLLLRLVEGDPHVGSELIRRIRAQCAEAPVARRTVGELRARAQEIQQMRERLEAERREAERRRQALEAEQARRTHLDTVRRRGIHVWSEIENEIERRNGPGYERAYALLSALKAIAVEQGTLAEFARRLEAIREKHARKGRFIERLNGLDSQ
jgi:hypothetical protein